MMKTITSIFFSPTDSTKQVIRHITSQFPLEKIEIDCTPYQEKNIEMSFDEDDLVLFGTPVYGGRLPAIALERMQHIHGDNTPVILLVTYGNRDYDDALLEFKDYANAHGFCIVAMLCVVCEHSIMHTIATHRPDEKDNQILDSFAKQIWHKVETTLPCSYGDIEVKGNFPYCTYTGIPLKPKASKKCTACGLCAQECPTQAIPKENPSQTNKNLCISCMRCMKICPQQARSLNPIVFSVAQKGLEMKCKERKESELFI